MIKFDKQKNNQGFALLFSVLLSSLLLAIGLSIFNITLKELALSTATARSVNALYAADSGRECALYWDEKSENVPTVVVGSTGGTITCNGSNIVLAGSVSDGATPVERSFSFSLVPNGPNTSVYIKKYLNPDPTGGPTALCRTQAICTTITADGWDTTGGDRAEREIKQNY